MGIPRMRFLGASNNSHYLFETLIEERESTEARICGDCEAIGRRENQCVDKSM
jgi:hypothetical protein